MNDNQKNATLDKKDKITDEVVLNAVLKSAVSKTGKPYYYIDVMITNDLGKRVFLEKAELEVLKLLGLIK